MDCNTLIKPLESKENKCKNPNDLLEMPPLKVTCSRWVTNSRSKKLSFEIILKDFRNRKHSIVIESSENPRSHNTMKKTNNYSIVSKSEWKRIESVYQEKYMQLIGKMSKKTKVKCN